MQIARIVQQEGSFLIFIENGKETSVIYEVKEVRNCLEEYVEKIWNWACERGLDKVFPITQAKKTLEEAQELVEAVEKGSVVEIMDAIGDVFVTLVIIAKLVGFNILECVKFAYNEIKDRQGKIVDGVFVKDEVI